MWKLYSRVFIFYACLLVYFLCCIFVGFDRKTIVTQSNIIYQFDDEFLLSCHLYYILLPVVDHSEIDRSVE